MLCILLLHRHSSYLGAFCLRWWKRSMFSVKWRCSDINLLLMKRWARSSPRSSSWKTFRRHFQPQIVHVVSVSPHGPLPVWSCQSPERSDITAVWQLSVIAHCDSKYQAEKTRRLLLSRLLKCFEDSCWHTHTHTLCCMWVTFSLIFHSIILKTKHETLCVHARGGTLRNTWRNSFTSQSSGKKTTRSRADRHNDVTKQ